MINSLDKFLLEKIKKYIQLDQGSNILCLSNIDDALKQLKPYSSDHVFNLEKTNNIRRINKFHESINSKLNKEGIYVSCTETLEERRKRIQNKSPFGLKNIIRIIDFVYNRVTPKLPILKVIYFFITKGHNRVISKAETLGRLISCGFDILEYFEYDNLLYVVSKKIKEPDFNMKVSYGPLFKMNRVGFKGEIIGVYKMRTMYPYSEYCQDLIVKENKLSQSGKVANDYRLTTWGRIFRKYWIDEIPMFINFFKRELNLVGVRPLSESYFFKYPKDLQQLRIKVRPGLIPPYYSDMPKSFEEILQSEKRYLEQKLKFPIRTDLKYFFKAFYNIFFKGARSS